MKNNLFDTNSFFNICNIIFNDYELNRNLYRQYTLQRKSCFYCRHYFKLEFLTKDHFIPKRMNMTLENNRVLACSKCNQLKGDLTLIEFTQKVKDLLKNEIISKKRKIKLLRIQSTCQDLFDYFSLNKEIV